MHVIHTTMGGLEVRMAETRDAGPPELAVLLCHGYGAPGTDLLPLAGELVALNPALKGRVRFYFPVAPLTLEAMGLYDARAWWHLDMEALQDAIERGIPRDRRNEKPEGLPSARKLLRHLLDEILMQTGLPMSKVVLGGFSQGSMLATDLALRLEEAPAALCVLSGTLLSQDEWRKGAQKRQGLKVLQTHGRQDALLPFELAEVLRDLFTEAGMQVDFHPFDDGHTIELESLRKMANLFAGLLPKIPT